MLVTIAISATKGAVRVAAEKRVEEVASERLRTDLIITAIEIDGLLQAERVDTLKALTLVLDLLGVRKVAERHTTVIECTGLFARAKLVEIRHGVRLADFVLRELVQVGLDQRAVLTVDALGAVVREPR